jgi:hypothetical protein
VTEEIGPLHQVEGDLEGKGAFGMVNESSAHGILETMTSIILVKP